MTPEIADRVRELAASTIDWELLLGDAHEHSVFPLLERQMRSVAAEAIPAGIAEKLKQDARANTVRCLALSAELIRVMEALESRGVAAIPYKGPTTAAQAYGDFTSREFEDLDVIVRASDLPAAHDAVSGLGYEARSPWVHDRGKAAKQAPGEYNYFHKERRTILELHTELTLRHFPVAPKLEEVLARRVEVDLGGRKVAALAPEDALVFLCVHGSKDFWAKLVWVADIAELSQAFPAMDWDAAARRAEELGAGRMMNLGLALAMDLLGAELPVEVKATVLRDEAAQGLAARLRRDLLARSATPMSARERFRFRRQLVPGAMAGWNYASRLTLAPAEDDWLMLRLPRPLAPLYLLLRPLRLLRKYG